MIALTFAARASAADIGKLLDNKEEPDNFQIIHVADLAKLMADPASKVQIFDANHPSTRENFGVIPGAHLLSSPRQIRRRQRVARRTRTRSWFSTAPIPIEWPRMKPPGGRSQQDIRMSR